MNLVEAQSAYADAVEATDTWARTIANAAVQSGFVPPATSDSFSAALVAEQAAKAQLLRVQKEARS